MSIDRDAYDLLPGLGWKKQHWIIEKLPDHLRICGICGGEGVYEQTYTAGCGMGYYQSEGRCDYCGGIGLRLDLDNNFVDTSQLTVSVADIKLALEARDAQR